MAVEFARQGKPQFLQTKLHSSAIRPVSTGFCNNLPNPWKHPDLLHRLYSVLPLKSSFAAARGDYDA
jgi:hypothetical protein